MKIERSTRYRGSVDLNIEGNAVCRAGARRVYSLIIASCCIAAGTHAFADEVTYLEAVGIPTGFVVDGYESSSTWPELPGRLEDSVWAASSSTALLVDPRSTTCRGSLACTAHLLARISVGVPRARRPPVSLIVSARVSGRALTLNLLAFSTNRLVEMPFADADAIPETARDAAEVFLAQSSVQVAVVPILARIDQVDALRPTVAALWREMETQVADVFVEEASRPSPVAALRLELPSVGATIRIDDHPSRNVASSQFEVTGLAPGAKSLEVTHPDYLPMRRVIEVKAGPNTLAIHLVPLPSPIERVSGSAWLTAGILAGAGVGTAAAAAVWVTNAEPLFATSKPASVWPRLFPNSRGGTGPALVPLAAALTVGALTTVVVDGLWAVEDRPAWVLPVTIVGTMLVAYGAGEITCFATGCRPQ